MRRSSNSDAEAVLAAAVAEHGRRFRRRANVVAIGVGVAYRESTGRFAPGDTQGTRPTLALKAIVRRKSKRVAPRDRLPRTVRVRVTDADGTRFVRVPVDIILQGEPLGGPALSAIAAVDRDDYPHTGFPKPGHRLFAGHADGSDNAPPGLASGFQWDIGTVGAVVSDGQRRYVVTAGHVLTDPYVAGAIFPERYRVGFALADTGLQVDNPAPAVPTMPADGPLIVDVVALPLTPRQAELSEQEVLGVASGSELSHFQGQGAVVRVERGTTIVDLPATVEAYFDRFDGRMNSKDVHFGPTLLLRCGGALPVVGDSGAPVVARHPTAGTPTLLGFHIGRTEGSATAAPVCYVMAAAPLLVRANLGLV